MNDETVTLVVVVGTLAALLVLGALIKAGKARRQHSLGEMYRPPPKDKEPPTQPHW